MLGFLNINKNNGCAIFFLTASVMMSGVLSGCSNNAVKPVAASKASEKAAPPAKREVVIVQKKTVGKDEHHAAYDKKRMWYNQQWMTQRQNAQKNRATATAASNIRNKKTYTRSAPAQPAKLPHYGLPGQFIQNQARQRPAQPQQRQQIAQRQQAQRQRQYASRGVVRQRRSDVNLAENLSQAAIARTYQRVRYDGRYIPIAYPMGDVPANIGVCTDTVIRSYRRLGVDLQRLVHEDMSRAFNAYPNLSKWGLSSPDPNIDHRRVHNLKVFFSRHGRRLPVTNNPADYRPGDLVTWDLRNGGQEHIGLVVNRRSPVDPNRYMIVHNIAKGDRMEDILFAMPITGHYRYLPNRNQQWIASAR
ncbi:MAG: Unknown protein [uncultured Thiotrichaceae bacterium]|uniref:DUF1287 domain-containing protein n=1 Tax=uncultured Thiotrichaceae bacterium TaxID=298394 RepID=A0A6S6TEU1_9GAMM|nr:MAG: Unknown protein [uncultured Thiotrichaceae bacterium]